ncbi:MAG: bifunctional riboflavin kinase/FAD synthetase [Desulfobacteraceae bacterium]|jgi:riboflavin kinase/FMN adenylyltransferase
MQIIEEIEAIKKPFKRAVLSIGNFDGVHIGHQALFHTTIEKAEAIGGTSIAMTFSPHPLRLLKPENHPPLITLDEQKVELIAKVGLDILICIPFTKIFAALSAKDFIKDLLVDRIGMCAAVVGKDYTFGRNREGNVPLLRQYGRELGFEVITPDWIQGVGTKDRRISSTIIRELVMAGKVVQAKKMLGRHYQIRGTVATGRNRGGKLLGFPTANINLQDELCPKSGIYAVTAEYENKTYPAVANIGYSPTFDDHIFTVEVHILDFNQNIYNRKLRVNFIKRLRDEIRFTSLEALSNQIRKDIELARTILAEHIPSA